MSFQPQTSAYACTCSKCKRKILVEIPQFGVSHIMAVMTICWDCLDDAQKGNAKSMYRITETTFEEVEARREAMTKAAEAAPKDP